MEIYKKTIKKFIEKNYNDIDVLESLLNNIEFVENKKDIEENLQWKYEKVLYITRQLKEAIKQYGIARKKIVESITGIEKIEIKANKEIENNVKRGYLKAFPVVMFLLKNENVTIKNEYKKENIKNMSISNLLYNNKSIIGCGYSVKNNTIVLKIK